MVSAVGLLLQGMKAGWDLYFAAATHRRAASALRLQEVGAILQLVEGLPLDTARKAAWKTEIIRTIRDQTPSANVLAAVERAVQEV
jgi:hypothetical protein